MPGIEFGILPFALRLLDLSTFEAKSLVSFLAVQLARCRRFISEDTKRISRCYEQHCGCWSGL